MLQVNISPRVMSLKQYLRSRYGYSSAVMSGQYSSCLEKLSKFKNHVAFTARCKKEQVIPPSLRIRPPVDTVRGREIAERASRQFLNERLRIANFKCRELQDELKWREIGLRRTLDQEDFGKLKQISEKHAEKIFLQVREKQREKFAKYSDRKKKGRGAKAGEGSINKTRWVLNFSKHNLTELERKALERGLNFSDCHSKIPRESIIAGVEAALRKCKDEKRAEKARSTIASLLATAKPPTPTTTKEERDALHSLSKDEGIVILPADKGNATVILDKDEYEQKAMEILAKPPFRKLKRDPTKRNESRVNDGLKRLLNRKAIDKATYNSLRVSLNGSRPPLFYGSVKIHKPDRPLRPIVSATGSSTYNLSKHVGNILADYVKQGSSFLRDTRDFVAQLGGIKVSEDEILVSFDVKSLFTSVPVTDAINTIKDIITSDDEFEDRYKISTSTLIEMIRISLASTSFQFRSEHYELTDGLAMGSPLSPAVANLFMSHLEEKALATFHNPPKTWFRFVDDIFSIIRKVDAAALLRHLNQQHTSISFTMEIESEGKLPFLDVRVHRNEEGYLRTSIYRKPTHTGSYLNFDSNHPASAKRSVVSSLLKRLENITLGEAEKRNEEQRVRKELKANGYPARFVNETKHRLQKSQRNPRLARTDTVEAVASIPYVQGVSQAIGRILAPLNIRTVSTTKQRKWSMMRGVKDAFPKTRQPGVVYALGCKDCSAVYIGETTRTAEQRTKEHRDHMNKGSTNMSAVAKHAVETGHGIHWHPRVLRTERETVKRKVREALLINALAKNNRDCLMNQDTGMDLSNLWLN